MLIKALLVGIVALIALCILAFGLGAAVIALRTLVRVVRAPIQAWRSREWQEARGTVTRSLITQSRTGRRVSFTPKIAYAYKVAGQGYTSTRYRFESTWAGADYILEDARQVVARFPKGASVTVFYDPAEPESATLDRRRAGLGGGLFFSLLLLLLAAGAIPLGVDMLIGAVTDPPQFAAGELPPLHHQVGGLVAIVAGLTLLVAGIRMLGARRNRGLVRRLAALSPTKIAAVQEDEEVAVFGRAEASDAGTMEAPVTGVPVVYYRARIVVGGDARSQDIGHSEFYVRDESGRLIVSTEGGTDLVCASPLPDDPAVQAWVDASFEDTPLPVPENYVAELAKVEPGRSVLVVGRASRDPDSGELVLEAEPGDPASLVFSGESLPDLVCRLTRGARRSRAVAVGAAVALLVGLALVAF